MYNAITRGIEPELVPACRRFGLDIVVYNPIAGGLFSGKIKSMDMDPAEGRFSTKSSSGALYRGRYFKESTFRALQTIEGAGMRMLYAPSVGEKEPILVAMRGDRKASDSMDDKIVELVETAELSASTASPPPSAAMWEDWDL